MWLLIWRINSLFQQYISSSPFSENLKLVINVHIFYLFSCNTVREHALTSDSPSTHDAAGQRLHCCRNIFRSRRQPYTRYFGCAILLPSVHPELVSTKIQTSFKLLKSGLCEKKGTANNSFCWNERLRKYI